MQYDILTKKPPEKVEINGTEYPINWDFRVGIKMEGILYSDMPENEKYVEMLKLYYPEIPEDIVGAIEKIIWFYRCGQELEEKEEKTRYQRRKSKDPAWVFSQDAPYVYTAFKEKYDIDLTEIDILHWWKFMALFESLGEDTKMSKIIYYRQVSTSGMSKTHRAFINNMKNLYKIKGSGHKKMTLEERNRKWKEYVKNR